MQLVALLGKLVALLLEFTVLSEQGGLMPFVLPIDAQHEEDHSEEEHDDGYAGIEE